jgi:DNA-binding transcriptional MocR family regulator
MTNSKYRQLAEALLAQINSGELPPEARLPSMRAMAKEKAVNIATVVSAYKYLESIGCVYTRVGSGTYVANASAKQPPQAEISRFNFAGTDTDPALFPSEAFGQCLTEVLKRDGKSAFNQDDSLGCTSLREAIASEINIDPLRIVILSSLQQGLDLVKKSGSFIINEDLYGDFYYEGTPPPSRWEADPQGRVVYIKSYSKILMPDLAYMAVPQVLAEGIARHFQCTVSGLLQRAFELFLRGGGFAAHAAVMRTVYGKRYRKVLAAVEAYLSAYADFDRPVNGLGIPVRPKNMNEREQKIFYQRLLQRGVVVLPGNMTNTPGFKLNFAAVPEERIAEGIGIIAAVAALLRTEAR